MATSNEIWINTGQRLERLDLFADAALLATFQANDRTKPESIQSDYSPEFEAPGTAHNHRLLRHAAASQTTAKQPYARLPCVLTAGGVELLPLGLLYIKGFKEGKYQLQVAGGNRRLVEALKKADGSDKMLSDLDLSRFNHAWTPANVLAGLPYAHWQAQGWGYELFDRGKPLHLQQVNPYDLYPSVAADLVFKQLVADAGFTADDLSSEPLFAALSVPSANPYTFPDTFRAARKLQAGYSYQPDPVERYFYHHDGGFASERLLLTYTDRAPYHTPDFTTGTSYGVGVFTAGTLGYYDLSASVPTFWGCNSSRPGKVRVKFMLKVNGQSVFDASGNELGKDEADGKGYTTQTFAPKLSRYLLHVGDTVELQWLGTELSTAGVGPDQPRWAIGPYGSQVLLASGRALAAEVSFTCELLAEFPQGGVVKLQDWLPQMSQLAFFKSICLLLGLTVQVDPYTNHLRLATGAKLLSPAQVAKARDWTRKRDCFAPPGRLPERDLSFRFGSYAQANYLRFSEDESVTTGYGDGSITVVDAALPATNDLATLPFAATLPSDLVAGLLAITNYAVQDAAATPPTFSAVIAKPRLVLRRADGPVSGQLITTPQVGKPGDGNYAAAVLTPFTTTVSYFAGAGVSLLLGGTVLTDYWADLRAMLDESRYLVERYRLTPADIAGLDFSVPIWDGLLGDFFAVSAVSEYDPRRSVEMRLCRLNATHLPPPALPAGDLHEWYQGEFWAGEWY